MGASFDGQARGLCFVMFQHKVSAILLWWPGCFWPGGCDLWSMPDSRRTLSNLRRIRLARHVMSEYRSPAPCTEFIRISLRQSLPLYTQGCPSILKEDKQLSNLYWLHWEAKAAPISKYRAIEWTSSKNQVQTTFLSMNHWASLKCEMPMAALKAYLLPFPIQPISSLLCILSSAPGDLMAYPQ